MSELKLIKIELLLPHERIIPDRLDHMYKKINCEKYVDFPVIIDYRTHVIIDGHHRHFSLRYMFGATYCPCLCVDYLDDNNIIIATSRIPNLTKQDIITTGLGRKPYGPKTTKHSFNYNNLQINYHTKGLF